MKNIKLYIILFLSVLNMGLLHAQVSNISDDGIVNGKIRIKLKKGILKESQNLTLDLRNENPKEINVYNIDKASHDLGITKIKRVFPFSQKFEARHRKYNLHLWYEVEFDSTQSPDKFINKYKKLTEIEIAKPVYKITRLDADKKPVIFKQQASDKSNSDLNVIAADFNDPLLPKQWHYENDGRFGSEISDIDLFDAWKTTSGRSDIIIAIVDQGIDFNHEDLKSNIWTNQAEINGIEGVDDDQNGYIDDYHGMNFNVPGPITPGQHGTHVAGTVAAVGNNGIGVAGVAGGNGSGNGVKLMSTQVFDYRTNGGLNFAEAIVYGADNGAVISQNSWGYNRDNYYEPEVIDAIRYFIAEAGQYDGSPMKGGILFFASGNDGIETNRYPGAFDEVIAVSATGPTGLPAPYSNFGNWVDISAPGGDTTNFGEEAGVLSTLPGNQYGFIEGTSMSCPHVSGVAALVISKFGGDNFTPNDLRRIIINSTTPFRFQHNSKYGKGILNAKKALIDDNRIPPNAITDLGSTEVFHDEVRLSWTVPNDDDGFSPSSYYLAISESPITASNFDNNSVFVIENNLAIGETFKINIVNLFKQTNYWFAVKSIDQFENISDISNIYTVTTTSEPHFMTSTRSIDVSIDVNQDPLANIPISFSNIAEGIIYWETLISNETYFRSADANISTTSKISYKKSGDTSTSTSSITDLGTSIDAVKYIDEQMLATSSLSSNEHWKNDTTEFIAGISYENGTPPAVLAGTGNTNAGLIFGTRFDIPYDFSFNLTHLEVALLPETNEFPIVIEVKKGSRNDMTKAETVYLQEYYPDAVNEFRYYRIPIYKPQKFQDNESFWVVLHFPKEMNNPLVLQYGGGEYNERFIFSRNNGLNYEQAVNLLFRPVIPMLRVLSTGEDGSYVFLDPNNGEIHKNASQNVNITVDANSLSNGKHLASIGILTNDIHKPVVNIELKLKVEGQLPEIDNSIINEYKAFVNTDNNLELPIENKGYGNLEVYGYTLEGSGLVNTFSETLIVKSKDFGKVDFVYNPLVTGLINDKIILKTNINDIPFNIRVISDNEPKMSLSLSTNNVNVNYGSKAQISLNISNDLTGGELQYNLEHYSIINKNAGIQPQKLKYTIHSSKDIGGPAPNKWDDISGFGISIPITELGSIPLGLKFPFFDQMLNNVRINILGQIEIQNFVAMKPLRINGKPLNIKEIKYYSFGDRVVFSFVCDLKYFGSKGYDAYGESVIYQVVLFKDGTIEYRYQDVTDITPADDFEIYVQGVYVVDRLTFRKYGDNISINNGLVVSFTPDRTISMISETSSLKGIIQKGSTKSVNLFIDPKAFGLTSGTYNDKIIVKNNTAAKMDSIPVIINVLGIPKVVVADSVHFKKPIFIGQSDIHYLKISNTGAKAINLTSATVNLLQFTVDNSLFPIEVKAASNIMLPVKFIPTNTNELVDKITVRFEDGSIYQAVLRANGKEDAKYIHNLQLPISVNLVGGEKTSVPFQITNTSNSVGLEYVFKNSVFTSVANSTSGKGIGENNNAVTQDYGYTWKLSDSFKIFHKWDQLELDEGRMDIKANKYKSIELPFEFPFYGAYYKTIWVSSNGYISVIEPKNQPQLPEFNIEDEFNGIIAPFWGNLKPEENGDGINYKIEDNKLLVQWYKLTGQDATSDPGTISFQVEINSEGFIKFHYGEIESWGGLLKYGIKSPDGTEYLDEPKSQIMRWANIKDFTTYIISPPQIGSINVQQNETFNLTISAEDIYYPGTYQDTLTLVTNSKNQKSLEIPVQINVTGSPVLSVTDSLIWKDVIFKNNLVLTKQLKLVNKGYNSLKLSKINFEGLEALTLYDVNGNKIIKSSSGTLLNSINIKPWETFTLIVEIPVSQKKNQNGKIYYSGNFLSKETIVLATIVDSPIFNWDAQDQEYNLINTDKEVYTFNIANPGTSNLNYKLTPATVPFVSPTPQEPYISDKIGVYDFQKRVTVDSLALETKEVGDGVFTPFAVGANLAFANRFTAPAGGFNLTHIRSYTYLDKLEEYVTVMVYLGGNLPQSGRKLYEQQFVINKEVDKEWIYFPLEKPFFIPEGEHFYIILTHPVSNKYLGFDNSEDESLLQHSFSGVYQGNDKYYWWASYEQSMRSIWKIRPLTASGKNQWLTLNSYDGVVPAGKSVAVNATIDPVIAGKGKHSGKIIANSNDINNQREEITISLNINGAPEFKYFPNIYKDTLEIVETETKVLNYLFEDPEGEDMTISVEKDILGIEYEMTQTSSNTAQLTIRSNYESEGFYKIPVKVNDASGNTSLDTISLKIVNKNRPPVFNKDYSVITINLANKNQAITIDPSDLFFDPDGDDFQVLAGNYNPEIVDMALGSKYINLNAIKEGTGQLVFGADDGKENGFVLHLVYVVVINDINAVKGIINGNITDDESEDISVPALFYPNPVINKSAKLYYKLDQPSDVDIQIFNSNGQLKFEINKTKVPEGEQLQEIPFNSIPSGFYICILKAEGVLIKSFKIIVK